MITNGESEMTLVLLKIHFNFDLGEYNATSLLQNIRRNCRKKFAFR